MTYLTDRVCSVTRPRICITNPDQHCGLAMLLITSISLAAHVSQIVTFIRSQPVLFLGFQTRTGEIRTKTMHAWADRGLQTRIEATIC